MQLLLGLFFFSALLIADSSLQCEYCVSTTPNCFGRKQTCSYKNTVCLTLKIEINASAIIPATMKRCGTVRDCKHYESLLGKRLTGQPLNITDNLSGLLVGSVIKEVICMK
ncbi:phospholipase A2 inhibitor subunit gamma B-like [Thamnophis elegans]|uniref:phospholipase A2 inhibitor subunit gamma B-like n=1 Tax=Thamnophis elegans TaxID=35005 RepID=UPI0013770723|nr:phospholipase A2 inhibitor subunit gamma B-like [Thamnophis elegans]XP_032084280.1 phospholipase A2 inhibitor subunit gamma B-like [Thamnophis elegans]